MIIGVQTLLDVDIANAILTNTVPDLEPLQTENVRAPETDAKATCATTIRSLEGSSIEVDAGGSTDKDNKDSASCGISTPKENQSIQKLTKTDIEVSKPSLASLLSSKNDSINGENDVATAQLSFGLGLKASESKPEHDTVAQIKKRKYEVSTNHITKMKKSKCIFP